ncbi:hypothetical protein NFI96_028781 [Prochilodus magdalenae]|nr:hypothetical protein NFI96_028781 [Prochilodus magdalenae]
MSVFFRNALQAYLWTLILLWELEHKPAVMEPQDCVASPDVPVAILQKKILSAKSPEDKARYEKELDELIKAREVIRDSMHQIVEKCTGSPEQAQQVLNAKSSAYSTKEYKEVVEYFKNKGFNWHVPKYQTALQHLYLFANLIEEKVPVERIKAAIDEVSVNLRTEKDVAVSPNTE